MQTRKPLALTLTLLLLLPAAASAQQAPAPIGTVTALQGQATVGRPALPQPTPLKFREDVFFRDQITTQAQATVRLLLGGARASSRSGSSPRSPWMSPWPRPGSGGRS